MSEKWKIIDKVVTHNYELIGFMVFKMTVSISQLTSLRIMKPKQDDFFLPLMGEAEQKMQIWGI